MGILQRLFPAAYEYRMAGFANPSPAVLDAFGVQSTISGERVSIESALSLAAVRSAVAMISQAVGGLPLKVYRKTPTGDRVEADTHRCWYMLHDRPNSYTIARTFWTATAAQLLIYENSFIFKQRDLDGIVQELRHLDPCRVQIEVGDDGRKRYVIEGPPRKVYSDDDVLHIVGYSATGYAGDSRILQAKQTLGAALARARFESEFYGQGAQFGGVIEYPGRLGEQGTKNLASAMQGKHHGPGRRHLTPVLEEGATFKTTAMSLEQMQFAELAEQTRTEIAVLFNIPPSFLGATTGDSLTYATTESNQIQFAQMAVLPIADTIAKALSSDPGILPWNVMYAEFTLEALLRADMKTRAEYWEKLLAMEVVTPEYIAQRENLPKPPKPKPKPVPVVPMNPDAEGAVAVAEKQSNGRVPVS